MAAAVALLALLRGVLNPTSTGFALLLIVLFTATALGSGPALLASLIGVVCFNFFFLPPYGTLSISDPQNWVALGAFLITALTAGWLSASVRTRAEEAEAGQVEIKRLYEELQASFQLASHAEALRQSERLKSALLDAVTHDIRTPLTAIKASVTTLLDEQKGKTFDDELVSLDAATRRDMLEVINEESDRLNRFVEGLIELARIEAGEMQLRWRWSTIDEIIRTTLVRAESLTRNHNLRIDIAEEMPLVRVDSRAVSEVIYTLLDNAAKYSPLSTTIKIAAQHVDESVLVSVEDEGQGIPRDLRARVFDKFFRATRDGDRNAYQPTGTGMGLAIAKGIIEAHNGQIWIEDKESGRGTRFLLALPIGDDDVEVAPQQEMTSMPIDKAVV